MVAAAEEMTAKNEPTVSDRAQLRFPEETLAAFEFLETLGYSVQESAPTLVRYRRGRLEVTISHNRLSYEIDFELSKGTKNYYVSEILFLSDPIRARQYRSFASHTPEGVAEGISRLSQTVRTYALHALTGSPSIFARLSKARRVLGKEYDLDLLECQIRPDAVEAFRRGDYSKAIKLYKKIQNRLTPSELKKLSLAKQRAKL